MAGIFHEIGGGVEFLFTMAQAEQQPRREQAGLGAWLERPVGRWVTVMIAGAILSAPAWLLYDRLRPFILANDDYAFIVESRNWATTRANLLVPHEAHVVPLFRLWTYALVTLAGPLTNLPLALSVASYFALVLTMLLVGYLTARETQQTAVGLLAMAGLGLSTVVEPAVSWYSAGQPLWAAAGIVLTILLARSWCLNGGPLRFGNAVALALAAPALWTAGVIAGPAGIAYLWGKKPCRSRGLSLALAGATACFVVFLGTSIRKHVSENKVIWQQHYELWPRPIQAVLHTAQAIGETLVLANLGIDAIVSPVQAVWLVLGLGGIWIWSRGGLRRLNALEAAGATVILGSYLIIYTFRGNHPYVSLRGAVWYHVIAQVGTVLFVSGWWVELRRSGPRVEQERAQSVPAASLAATAASRALPALLRPAPGRLTRKEALIVLGLAYMLYSMQVPRALAIVLRGVPPIAASERQIFPDPILQRQRAMFLRKASHERQERVLARIDLARPIARRMRASPEALRRTFANVLVPGKIEGMMVDLLNLPPDQPNAQTDPARLRSALGHLLLTEPEPRPFWLDPKDPWPPPS
jgi:hypothetical protein